MKFELTSEMCFILFQPVVVGLNRSDYMLDQRKDGSSSLKQIEINTMAAGGFGVAVHLPEVHRYLTIIDKELSCLALLFICTKIWCSLIVRHILRSVDLFKESECVPDTNRTPGMSAALAKGWELYGEQK